jgi:hypothetical protein
LSDDFLIIDYEKVIKKITRFISDQVRTRKKDGILVGSAKCEKNGKFLISTKIQDNAELTKNRLFTFFIVHSLTNLTGEVNICPKDYHTNAALYLLL